jgi:hypothetical protein
MLDPDPQHCEQIYSDPFPPISSEGTVPDSGVEPLAVLENVEGERHLHALPLLLDAQQGALQVQPERDLLRMRRGQSHVSFHQEILSKRAGQRRTNPDEFKI